MSFFKVFGRFLGCNRGFYQNLEGFLNEFVS